VLNFIAAVDMVPVSQRAGLGRLLLQQLQAGSEVAPGTCDGTSAASCRRQPVREAFPASLIASDASIEAALEPVKLIECICQGDRYVPSRFAVQTLCLDQPGTSSRIPERALKVASGLRVVVRALPPGSVRASDRQPSDSDVVHDHIRLRQHQISAIASIGVSIGAWHVKHAGTVGRGKAVGCSSGSSQLSPSWGLTETARSGNCDHLSMD
jgi:hypothetical protein